MGLTRDEFLADLEVELQACETPTSTHGIIAPRPRRMGKYAFAAVAAILSPMLSLMPSPAAASTTCYTPDFVRETHTKTCSNPMSWAKHTYQRTSYPGANVVCHHFYSTAHNVCGSGTVYVIGNKERCKSY